jgi:hypothetical protein
MQSGASMKLDTTGQFVLGGLLAGIAFLVYAVVVAAFSGVSIAGIAFLMSIWAATMTVCVIATFWFGRKRTARKADKTESREHSS